jgi:hypothetical protein
VLVLNSIFKYHQLLLQKACRGFIILSLFNFVPAFQEIPGAAAFCLRCSVVNGSLWIHSGRIRSWLEYLGNVNSISAALVGISIGMFIMSWNISTFVLFSKHFKFLAATTNPFLKTHQQFCYPCSLIVFYFSEHTSLPGTKNLSVMWRYFLAGGFLSGLILTGYFYLFFVLIALYSPDDADEQPGGLYHPSAPGKSLVS